MMNQYFGELTFDCGWTTKRNIHLFDKNYEIEVYLLAYKSEREILAVQDDACRTYLENEKENLACMEKLLLDYSDDAALRFTPSSLYFDRDGGCALLCDDEQDLDEGIAVCILPEKSVEYQSDYL